MAIAPAKETTTEINVNQTAGNLKDFKTLMTSRTNAIQNIAASNLDAKRLTKIVIACVTRTPALRNCTIASILRATMQAAELGLEPGSAIGSAYLVPYGKECQLIIGYRGLIDLAFRSGQIASIKATAVYQGDVFEYEEGIEPKLRHVPNFENSRDDKDITFAFVVIKTVSGGTLYDVMTRGEIDRIRKKSKSGSNGPWVTDFAEMAKKTVTRRGLKYAPMSIELTKAMAVDAVDHGDTYDAEFSDIFEDEEPEAESKTSRVANKLPATPEEEAYTGPTVKPEEAQGVIE